MTLQKDELARLTWEHLEGSVVLRIDWRFHAEPQGDEYDRKEIEMLASLANMDAVGYSYSPADGEPGGRLASQVAERLRGKAEYRPASPPRDDAVY